MKDLSDLQSIAHQGRQPVLDGNIDVLGINSTNNEIAWWDINE